MKKTYKLLRWYPSLPKDWKAGKTIVNRCEGITSYVSEAPYSCKFLGKMEVENQPEYWATIVEDTPEYVEFQGEVYKVKDWTNRTYCILESERRLEPFKDLVKPSTKEAYDHQEKLRELQKRFLAGSTVRLINDAGMNAKYGNLATVKKCLFDKGHKYWEGGYMLDVEWDRSTGTTQQDGEYYSKDFELVETKKRHSCSRWGCNLNYI